MKKPSKSLQTQSFTLLECQKQASFDYIYMLHFPTEASIIKALRHYVPGNYIRTK
jgi:hypothetical protein